MLRNAIYEDIKTLAKVRFTETTGVQTTVLAAGGRITTILNINLSLLRIVYRDNNSDWPVVGCSLRCRKCHA